MLLLNGVMVKGVAAETSRARGTAVVNSFLIHVLLVVAGRLLMMALLMWLFLFALLAIWHAIRVAAWTTARQVVGIEIIGNGISCGPVMAVSFVARSACDAGHTKVSRGSQVTQFWLLTIVGFGLRFGGREAVQLLIITAAVATGGRCG